MCKWVRITGQGVGHYSWPVTAMEEVSIKMEDETLIYGKKDNSVIVRNTDKTISANVEHFSCALPNFNKIKNQKIVELTANSIGNSPLSNKNPLGYGLIFHKILEDALTAKNLSLMSKHPLIKTLDTELQNRINASIEKITSNDDFSKLVQKDVKTEISIGTNTDDIKIGRIDLMIIDQDDVIIIDYKSDKNPPRSTDFIPPNYINQLILYKKMVKIIYPDKNIKTMILWLQNGILTEV